MSRPRQPARRPATRFMGAGALAAMGATLALIAAAVAGASAPEVEVSAAWMRWLPAGLPAGGYLTLHNRGSRPATLVGASSADYAQISMHLSVNQAGTSSMRPVEQIRLGPGESVSFAAGGYHLMLEHPTITVHPGDHVPITLHFAGGPSMTVSFEVRQSDS